MKQYLIIVRDKNVLKELNDKIAKDCQKRITFILEEMMKDIKCI